MTAIPNAIYDFWFGGPNLDEFSQSRKPWFVKDAAFDEEIRHRFRATLESAERGELSIGVTILSIASASLFCWTNSRVTCFATRRARLRRILWRWRPHASPSRNATTKR